MDQKFRLILAASILTESSDCCHANAGFSHFLASVPYLSCRRFAFGFLESILVCKVLHFSKKNAQNSKMSDYYHIFDLIQETADCLINASHEDDNSFFSFFFFYLFHGIYSFANIRLVASRMKQH